MIESEGYESDASAYSEATYRYDADDEFTSPTEWNPSMNDDHRTSEEMIRISPLYLMKLSMNSTIIRITSIMSIYGDTTMKNLWEDPIKIDKDLISVEDILSPAEAISNKIKSDAEAIANIIKSDAIVLDDVLMCSGKSINHHHRRRLTSTTNKK